jgi:hypothetical protein
MAKSKFGAEIGHRKTERGVMEKSISMAWAVKNKGRRLSTKSTARILRTIREMPRFLWQHTPLFDNKGQRIHTDIGQLYSLLNSYRIPFSMDQIRVHIPDNNDPECVPPGWTLQYLATNPDGTHDHQWDDTTIAETTQNHHSPPKHVPAPWTPEQDLYDHQHATQTLRDTAQSKHGLVKERWNLPVTQHQDQIFEAILRKTAELAEKASDEEAADRWEKEVTENWRQWWRGDEGDI